MLVGFDGTFEDLLVHFKEFRKALSDDTLWSRPISMRSAVPLMALAATGVGALAAGALAVTKSALEISGPAAHAEIEKQKALLRNYSFVSQLCAKFPLRDNYFEGPGTLGLQDSQIVTKAMNFIACKRPMIDKEGLVLVGYSRGALNAAVVASKLKKLEIWVDLLILLDPVDRDGYPGFDASTISQNVSKLIRVYRSTNTDSRWYFGKEPASQGKHMLFSQDAVDNFDGTHAAMGGLPATAGEAVKFTNKPLAGNMAGSTPAAYQSVPFRPEDDYAAAVAAADFLNRSIAGSVVGGRKIQDPGLRVKFFGTKAV